MKNLFYILFIIIASTTVASAQSQSEYNYSLGIRALTIEEFPKLLNEVRNSSNFYTSGLNGLIFKINDNQISYRFQVSNLKKEDYSVKNECETCEILDGKYESFDIKLGFERSIVYSRLQPFYGIDLGFKRANFDGKSSDASTNAFLYNANIEKNGGLIYPFFGLKFNLFSELTISAESGIDFLYTHDKEIKSSNTNTPTSVNNFSRWQFNTKPLGMLSLQFNFGKD